MNDGVSRQTQTSNPATTAMLQEKEQDVQIEDYIMCYGETAIRPLFRILYWFITQDAEHPCVQNRFIQVTGKPSIDHARKLVGEWRDREHFKVNVGLGVDSPDYKQAKATQLLQVFQAFNGAMSGGILPNLMPKLFEAFRDQVEALGYNADQSLMSRDEFQQFYQNLLQQQQQQSQQAQQQQQQQAQLGQVTDQLNVQLLQEQVRQLQTASQEMAAKAQKAMADVQKALAEVDKVKADSLLAIKELHAPIKTDNVKVVV
jgi:hypothetical protein